MYIKRSTLIYKTIISLILIIKGLNFAIAQQLGDTVNFTFTGRMVEMNPCVISNDAVIDVPFGNVSITKVDTGMYVQEIKYTVNCPNIKPNSIVYLTFKTTQALYDRSTMESNVDGLLVRILKDGTPIELNKEMIINLTAQPKLEAALLRDPKKTLKEAPFAIFSTIIIEYQ